MGMQPMKMPGTMGQMMPGTMGQMMPGTMGQMMPGMMGQMMPGAMGQMMPGAMGQMMPGMMGQMKPGTMGQMMPGTMGQMMPGTMGQMMPGTMGQMTPGMMGQMSPGTMSQMISAMTSQMMPGTMGQTMPGMTNQMRPGTQTMGMMMPMPPAGQRPAPMGPPSGQMTTAGQAMPTVAVPMGQRPAMGQMPASAPTMASTAPPSPANMAQRPAGAPAAGQQPGMPRNFPSTMGQENFDSITEVDLVMGLTETATVEETSEESTVIENAFVTSTVEETTIAATEETSTDSIDQKPVGPPVTQSTSLLGQKKSQYKVSHSQASMIYSSQPLVGTKNHKQTLTTQQKTESVLTSENKENLKILKRRKRNDMFDILHRANRCERAYKICITRSKHYIISRIRNSRRSEQKSKSNECFDNSARIVYDLRENLCPHMQLSDIIKSSGIKEASETINPISQANDPLGAIIIHDEYTEGSDFHPQNNPHIIPISSYSRPEVFPDRTPPLIALEEEIKPLTRNANDSFIFQTNPVDLN